MEYQIIQNGYIFLTQDFLILYIILFKKQKNTNPTILLSSYTNERN
jgi:hypothetical protein